ncbi:transformer-2 protein homolog beta-like isoform X4 [Atheta coriaria]|uniref:transformer-2 protein homolog beta-like isoform X4 n=1 Tax=Dalotia coriaria TaxID=877792 RepID=UPI0031F35BCF
MSDRQLSRSPPNHHNHLQMNDGDRDRERDRDRSPHHDRRDESPRGHKVKRDRSPSRGSNYRDDRDRDRRDRRDGGRDDRDRYRESRRYRSRSRSRSDKHYKVSRYSRSRSRSYGGRRSPSHSPMSSRRRHIGPRDNPKPSGCLGVFGLSVYTTEVELYHIFSKYGPVERVQVVLDAKTGKSRGFSFVYFESSEDAKVAKEECTGMKINGKNIRVDFSITQRAHTPTPGMYLGKPTYVPTSKWDRSRGRDRGERERERDDHPRKYRRTPSPHYRRGRRYERTRSRSYSPRHY